MHKNETIPKPVLIRLLMLFGGGVGCLFVGIVVSLATEDLIMLAMSFILCIAFLTKGILLKRKINARQIFHISGVCVSIVPKMMNRYRRIELVNTDTGDDVHFILPKKVGFKVGHAYNCYFDHHISDRPVSVNNPKGDFLNAELDLPTNGFLGFEDFGVYQEKHAALAAVNVSDTEVDVGSTSNNPAGSADEAPQNIENNKEENL